MIGTEILLFFGFWLFVAWMTSKLSLRRLGNEWSGFVLALFLGLIGTAIVLLIPKRHD